MITVSTFSKSVRDRMARREAMQKKPLVSFNYPSSKSVTGNFTTRTVRLISANKTHLIGLETSDKNRFKKFRRDKVLYFSLLEFCPASMP